MCIEKCIIVDIVVSNVPKKYAILAGYKIVMNQRSVCTRFINPCHSSFALVSQDLEIAYKPRICYYILLSDIFHFAAIHFLPEQHSAMVLVIVIT